MKRKQLLVLYSLTAALLLSAGLQAQRRVSGRVTDRLDGSGIIGASVVEKGTSNGVITDLEGGYTLEVTTDTAVLVFTYTGYALVETPIGNRATVDIILGEDENLLDQVVVVGYGVQKKSDVTGAVGTVKGESIDYLPTPSVEQALQGKVAGVYVSPASGEPGAGAVVRIRGTGTLNNANPLYVIDGMIAYDANFVNPQDVESIEVLKDASAAAIYGSRGSNGVIIITTKKGKQRDNAVISLNSYYGTQQITKQIDVLNAAEFGQAYNELIGQSFYPDPSALGEGTNWQDEIFRSAPIGSIQLSADGGNDRYRYSVSGNYFNQSGVLKYSEFERATIRLNNDINLNKWLNVGTNLTFANTQRQNAATGAIGGAYRMPPVFTPTDSAGNYTDPTSPFGLAIGNPAADLYYRQDNYDKANRFFGAVYGDIKFLKNFTFRSNFGFDLNNSQYRNYLPLYDVSPSQVNIDDRLNTGVGNDRRWIWEQTLTYNKEWTKHRLTVLAGYTAEERRLESLGVVRSNFPGTNEELLYPTSANNDPTQMGSGGIIEEAITSALGRINYTLLDRYMLTATLRVDQSSRFAEANRTGYFPSFGLGWLVTNEPFMQNNQLFDRLKFRFSYGVLGNQNSIASQYYPSLGVIQSGLFAVFGPEESLNEGATLTNYSNPDLKWETSRQTDVGVEFGLFDNRLSGEIDWYNRFTYDIIAAVPIPDYVGSAGDPLVNTAEVRNTGWDIMLNWRQTGRFTWFVGGNFSPVKNEVVKLNDLRAEIFAAFLQGEAATHTVEGLPIGSFYGYKVAGVFQSAEEVATLPRLGNEGVGDLRFQDLNGDGVINTLDRTNLGSPIPTLTYGLNAGFEFAGLDFSADVLGVSGNEVFNAKKTFRFAVYNWEQSSFDNRWTPDNPSNSVPRITNGGHNYRVSDYFVEDGSFFRLRSVVLGYTLPQSWTQRAKISRLRVYLSGLNLWTSQDYSGYSPEFPNGANPFESGLDFAGYPVTKSFQGGIDITF
ncbi:MAG: TonB-dependent receptor [Saprospiraceae bacterium]|nr:TonB-dependent receptor [Saprospiraceae bacterium]